MLNFRKLLNLKPIALLVVIVLIFTSNAYSLESNKTTLRVPLTSNERMQRALEILGEELYEQVEDDVRDAHEVGGTAPYTDAEKKEKIRILKRKRGPNGKPIINVEKRRELFENWVVGKKSPTQSSQDFIPERTEPVNVLIIWPPYRSRPARVSTIHYLASSLIDNEFLGLYAEKLAQTYPGDDFYSSLAKYLSKSAPQFNVEVLDLSLAGDSFDLRDFVTQNNYHLIAFSSLTGNFKQTTETIEVTRTASPESAIILGGWHASALPEDSLTETDSDLVVKGQGVETFAEIALRLYFSEENLSPREQIQRISPFVGGIYYRDAKGQLINTGERELLFGYDHYPFPHRSYSLSVFDTAYDEEYIPDPRDLDKKIKVGFIHTSFGCPFRCLYCANPAVYRRYLSRDVELMRQEIEELYSTGVRAFSFRDETWSLVRERAMQIIAIMKEYKLRAEKEGDNFYWSCTTRADLLDREMLEAMKDSGLTTIYLGIESGDEGLMNAVKDSKIAMDKVLENIAIAEELRIVVVSYLQVGLPGQSFGSIIKTAHFLMKSGSYMASVFRTIPYPGSRYFDPNNNGPIRVLSDLADLHSELQTETDSLTTDEITLAMSCLNGINKATVLQRELAGENIIIGESQAYMSTLRLAAVVDLILNAHSSLPGSRRKEILDDITKNGTDFYRLYGVFLKHANSNPYHRDNPFNFIDDELDLDWNDRFDKFLSNIRFDNGFEYLRELDLEQMYYLLRLLYGLWDSSKEGFREVNFESMPPFLFKEYMQACLDFNKNEDGIKSISKEKVLTEYPALINISFEVEDGILTIKTKTKGLIVIRRIQELQATGIKADTINRKIKQEFNESEHHLQERIRIGDNNNFYVRAGGEYFEIVDGEVKNIDEAIFEQGRRILVKVVRGPDSRKALDSEIKRIASRLRKQLKRPPNIRETAEAMPSLRISRNPVALLYKHFQANDLDPSDYGIGKFSGKANITIGRNFLFAGARIRLPRQLDGRVRISAQKTPISNEAKIDIVDIKNPKNRLTLECIKEKGILRLTYIRPSGKKVTEDMTDIEGKTSLTLTLMPVFSDFYDTVFSIPLDQGKERLLAVAQHLRDKTFGVDYEQKERYINFHGRLYLPSWHETHPGRIRIYRDRENEARFLVFEDIANPDNIVGYEWREGKIIPLEEDSKLKITRTISINGDEMPGYDLHESSVFRDFDESLERSIEAGIAAPGDKRLFQISIGTGRFSFRTERDVSIISFEGQRSEDNKTRNDREAYPIRIVRTDDKSEIKIGYRNPDVQGEFTVEGLTWEDDGRPVALKGPADYAGNRGYFNLSTIIEMIRRNLLPGIKASDWLLETFGFSEGSEDPNLRNPIRSYRIEVTDSGEKFLVEDILVNPMTFEPFGHIENIKPTDTSL